MIHIMLKLMHYSTSYGINKRYIIQKYSLVFAEKNEFSMNDIYCGESMNLSDLNGAFFVKIERILNEILLT